MRPKYREFLGQVVVRDVSGLGFRIVLHTISTHANDYMTLVVAVSTSFWRGFGAQRLGWYPRPICTDEA